MRQVQTHFFMIGIVLMPLTDGGAPTAPTTEKLAAASTSSEEHSLIATSKYYIDPEDV